MRLFEAEFLYIEKYRPYIPSKTPISDDKNRTASLLCVRREVRSESEAVRVCG